MKKVILYSLFFFLFLTGFSRQNNNAMQLPNNSIGDAAIIEQLHKETFKELQKKSPAYLQKRLRDGFSFTSANGDLQSKDEYIQQLAINPLISFPLIDSRKIKVHVIGNTAILTAVVHINVIRNKETAPDLIDLWERFTETWFKENGEWRLLAQHATYMKKE